LQGCSHIIDIGADSYATAVLPVASVLRRVSPCADLPRFEAKAGSVDDITNLIAIRNCHKATVLSKDLVGWREHAYNVTTAIRTTPL